MLGLKNKHPNHPNSNLKRTLRVIQMMTLRLEDRAGFLILGTITFWARYFFILVGAVLHIVGCLVASLASTH